ncbi:uncharacterized protein FMAN_06568 [Fusarium mangiferae]|uniref:Uncharacterized protein n=1 Tax=Fusarium mangiferae TaxID=192010 RepID=A0A1L7SK28_FUSMA|nr:uncharacterized protein FMAN_06568 [Fusarium mangiferae]CVK85990.1 uncharacterized protein FMAN_06568 [Fusarium mangiferae]
MSPEASEKTDVSVETPSKEAGEMLSKESVEKPGMTGQVTKALETEATQERVKEVNGRRFTYRYRYKDGPFHPLLKDWLDEDGHSIEWWEKKSLLRDWIYGRMSPEEFDAHFPHYWGPPKESYRITKEALAMPQEEKESFGPKESDELHTQHYANNYGDGSGLPLRPGMGPVTDEQKNLSSKEILLLRDWVHGRMSSEEFDAHFPNYNGPKDCYRYNKEEVSDVQSPNSHESDEDCTEEGFHCMMEDDTEEMLCDEYYACLHEERLKEGLHEAKPRYASYYGDGSGLPLRPGMGPPMTEEESQESWKKSQEQFEILWNMNDKEFHAQHPEHNAIKDFCLTEEEAEKLLEGDDDEQPRYSHNCGDGSDLPLRPGMGPPKTKEEQEESLKEWEAEDDKIFNMSEEEFNAEFPGYKDIPVYLCPEYEAYRIMEECDEADDRRRDEVLREWKESIKARPEDQV